MQKNKKSKTITDPSCFNQIKQSKRLKTEQAPYSNIRHRTPDYTKKIIKDNEYLRATIKFLQHKNKDKSSSNKDKKFQQNELEKTNKKLRERIQYLQKEGQIQREKYNSLKNEYDFLKDKQKKQSQNKDYFQRDDLVQHYSNMNIGLKKQILITKREFTQKLQQLLHPAQQEVQLFQRLGIKYSQ